MSDTFDNSNLYEGMILLSQQAVGAGLGAAIDHIREILERADAQVITLRKWDDRKLAYPIKGQKRGVYILSLFRIDGGRLTEIERAFNLSEQVVRTMVTRCEHFGQVEYDAELDAAKHSATEQKLREEPEEPADFDDADDEDESIETTESAVD